MSSLVLVLLMAACFALGAVVSYRSTPIVRGWPRGVRAAGMGLLVTGAVGFLSAFVAATGGLDRLPPGFELPAVHESGVINLRDGTRVVPLTHAGRIQLYDAEWRFLRGWQLDAGGGTFYLDRLARDDIQVALVRPRRIEIFAPDGRLLSTRALRSASSDRHGRNGYSVSVPTHPLLWIWSGPFCSWLTAALGGFIVWFAETRRARVVRPR